MNKLKNPLVVIIILMATFSNEIMAQEQEYEYAVVLIRPRDAAKGLRVSVDLGDTPEQVKQGREYSEILDKKESYTAVLNFMPRQGFEFIETAISSTAHQGTSATFSTIFIFRRKL